MHNQDHSSNLVTNSSLSMRLLNPQTNFTNASMNYSLIGYNTHPNNLHPGYQGNTSTYQSNPLWTINEHAENNNTLANYSNNNNEGTFGINNYQQIPHSIAFSQQATQLSQQPRQQQSNPQQQEQSLKVEDALNYLDQVKLQFGHQPQIYNDFLDIMKEFKSHSIDTTGVIMRVSRLFRGYPELIVGFNTFLPPGYNIEVHENETIQVYQPGHQVLNLNINNFDDAGISTSGPSVVNNDNIGPTTTSLNNNNNNNNIVVGIVNNNSVVNNSDNTYNIQPHNNNNSLSEQHFYQHSNHQYPHNNQQPPPPSLGLNTSALTLNATFPRQKHAEQLPLNMQTSHSNHPSVEFNHAISYVNKIKNCYQDKPEIYKAFLDILHNYQKEQKSLKEAQQKNLNPVTTTRRAQITESEVYSQVSVLFKDQPELLHEFRQFLPDATHSEANNNNSNNKLHRNSLMSLGASTKSSQLNATPQISPRNNDWSSHPPHKKAKFDLVDKFHSLFNDPELTRAVERAQTQGKEHVLREVLKHLEALRTSSTTPKDFHHSTTPILEKIPEIKHLLHSNLAKEFKSTNPVQAPLPHIPLPTHESNRVTKKSLQDKKVKTAAATAAKVAVKEEKRWYLDLSTCKRVGKSYRLLPSNFTHEVASARGSLEKQVLNDRFTLYPHCDSDGEEDDDDCESSIRRNLHEDHVFQCEDERYELDMVIDLNFSVLRELSRLASRMHKMTSDELAKFQIDDLQSALGVSNVHIETAFKRLYGDKYGVVLEGLRRCPRTAVPIVLRSLSCKDSEWRSSKRLFERMWSEQMDKHYLRSLDHQGLKFKQTDAKAIRSKSLVKEVEALLPDEEDGEEDVGADNDVAAVEEGNGGGGAKEKSKCPIKQLALPYPQQSAYQDAVSLVWSGLQKQSNIGAEEQERLKYLLEHLVPSIFFQHHPPSPSPCREEDQVDQWLSSEGATNSNSGAVAGEKDGRLEEEKKAKKDMSVPPVSPPSSFTPPSAFICNENWYVCIRLLVLLCQRLKSIKSIAEGMVLEDGAFKPLRSTLAHMALTARCQDSMEPRQHYPRFLAMVTSLMTGSIDPATFEDTLRELFGVNCYMAFTIDKLVHNVVRQLQHAICKEDSFGVQEEYWKYLWMEGRSQRKDASMVYQKAVEAILNDKMVFKYFIQTDSLSVQLLPFKSQQVSNNDNSTNSKTNNTLTQAVGHVKSDLDGSFGGSMHKTVNRFSRARCNIRRKEAIAVWSGIPDFYRKFRRRQKLLPLEEPSTEARLMQALNTLALAHAKSNPGRSGRMFAEDEEQERFDFRRSLGNNIENPAEGDAPVIKHCVVDAREEAKVLFTEERMKEEKFFDGALSRSRIKLASDTTILVCRPHSLASARKMHRKKTLSRLRRFERWMQTWLRKNTTADGVTRVANWLQGFEDVDNNIHDTNDALPSSIDLTRNCDVPRSDARLKRKWLVQKVLVNPDTDSHRHSLLLHQEAACDNKAVNNVKESNCQFDISSGRCIGPNNLMVNSFNHDADDLIKKQLINQCINALSKHDSDSNLHDTTNCNEEVNNHVKCSEGKNYNNDFNRPPYRFYHKYRLSKSS